MVSARPCVITQTRSQAEAEEAAASSDLAQIDNVLIMCSHDITYHFNIWTLCNTLFWDFETDTTYKCPILPPLFWKSGYSPVTYRMTRLQPKSFYRLTIELES